MQTTMTRIPKIAIYAFLHFGHFQFFVVSESLQIHFDALELRMSCTQLIEALKLQPAHIEVLWLISIFPSVKQIDIYPGLLIIQSS